MAREPYWPPVGSTERKRLILDFMLTAYRIDRAEHRQSPWLVLVQMTVQIGAAFGVTTSEVHELADMAVRDLFP